MKAHLVSGLRKSRHVRIDQSKELASDESLPLNHHSPRVFADGKRQEFHGRQSFSTLFLRQVHM